MPFQYLTNTPLDEAVLHYMQTLAGNGLSHRAETIRAEDSAGRVTATPVYAKACAPHYNACAMDGVATLASATFGATETTPVELTDKQFIYVDTGDPLPDGFDAVIMIEDVVETTHGIRLYAPVAPFANVRQIGEDICAGEMLLTSFSSITPAATGAMLASGISEVEVIKKPVVGIIPTGDEVVLPHQHPAPGDIIEFNSTIFKGMLNEWGADAKVYPIVPDDLGLIEDALRHALSECDAVILNAGSSAGRDDYSAEAMRNVGKVLYHGVAIKPGKPAVLGYAGETPVLGVPGYPVSAIIVLEYILRPILEVMTGVPISTDEGDAFISRPLVSSLKYREFIRARLGSVDGKLIAVPLNRGAGVVSSFVKADALIDIPQNIEGYAAGSSVKLRLLRPISEIERTLVVTGSHDPLIDEIAEIMKKKNRQAAVASSHVGSMGGIFAIKRGEAHIAGIHLLDEETGEYNTKYVKRYFPTGGVKLIGGVYREQGLMVQKGNPMKLREVTDLTKPGIRYVNRQKGSGTRILIDYLCGKERIDTSSIYGYAREEFTHTAVAALIASNSADAGLGIYSAAKIYGLDFIPICNEQYDFLILDEAMDFPPVLLWLETLASDQFHARAAAMGGYKVRERVALSNNE